jgi:hypothetical protein
LRAFYAYSCVYIEANRTGEAAAVIYTLRTVIHTFEAAITNVTIVSKNARDTGRRIAGKTVNRTILAQSRPIQKGTHHAIQTITVIHAIPAIG